MPVRVRLAGCNPALQALIPLTGRDAAEGREVNGAREGTRHETLLMYFFGDTDRYYRRNFEFFVQRGLRGSSCARVYCLIIVRRKVTGKTLS